MGLFRLDRKIAGIFCRGWVEFLTYEWIDKALSSCYVVSDDFGQDFLRKEVQKSHQ